HNKFTHASYTFSSPSRRGPQLRTNNRANDIRRATPPSAFSLQPSALPMTSVRVAVLGAGALGKQHARIYSELAASSAVEFTGVHDLQPETAQSLAEKYRVKAFASAADAGEASEALSIVTPTNTHFELARVMLQQGKHLLVEKPMTDSAAQAAEL